MTWLSKPDVLIYRGLPGSGKTTQWAQEWRQNDLGEAMVFSTDHFFMKRGVYLFDKAKLAEAHGWCFHNYLEQIRVGLVGLADRLVIVDNTNISATELAPYIQAANAYELSHLIVTVWCDPVVAFKRNTHNVPLSVILAMHSKLITEQLPPWWNHEVVLAKE